MSITQLLKLFDGLYFEILIEKCYFPQVQKTKVFGKEVEE